MILNFKVSSSYPSVFNTNTKQFVAGWAGLTLALTHSVLQIASDLSGKLEYRYVR